MKSLYQASVADEVRQRIERVRPDSVRQWGKMNPAQMLAHAALTMENALGDTAWPRHPLGRVIGGWAKRGLIVKGKPMARGAPTHPSVRIADQRNFDAEKNRLQRSIDRFTSGRTACTRHPHFFFGPMTPEEWATFMYIHLDHHLRQFNV